METVEAFRLIKSRSDGDLFSVARHHVASPVHAELMDAIGLGTNPRWVTGEAIVTLYHRRLIDEHKMDFFKEKCGL